MLKTYILFQQAIVFCCLSSFTVVTLPIRVAIAIYFCLSFPQTSMAETMVLVLGTIIVTIFKTATTITTSTLTLLPALFLL